MAGVTLPFIVSNGPKLPDDPSIRRLIRGQAMKDVAQLRKKRGTNRRVNAGQLPKSVLSSSSYTSSSERTEIGSSTEGSSTASRYYSDFDTSPSTDSYDESEEHDSYSSQLIRTKDNVIVRLPDSVSHIFGTPPFSPYEATRSKFEIDITDLAMLTDCNVGKPTMAMLSTDPSRLMTLLGLSKWSYLQFVPSYYGTSDCLTAATDCLLARVRGVLMPYTGVQKFELQLYAKALRSLQMALQDPVSCMRADVLCATQILSVRELLDFAKDTAWTHHLQGSVRLVKYRTSHRFTTEFEKALFLAHFGPVVLDALVSDKSCYLAEPQWMELYRSLARPSMLLNDRHPLAIEVRSYMFQIPGLWHEIEAIVTNPQPFDEAQLSSFTDQCRQLHSLFEAWLCKYNVYCQSSYQTPPATELEMRHELYGLALECLIVLKRLLATVDDTEREYLEIEAVALAHAILNLQKAPSAKHSWLFSRMQMGVAHSVLASTDMWEDRTIYENDHQSDVARRERYMAWSSKLRSPG